MIIIGNDNTLKHDNNWLQVINACIRNKNYKGDIDNRNNQTIIKPAGCLDDSKNIENIEWSNKFKFQLNLLQ